MSESFKLIEGLAPQLQEGNKATVVTGDQKSGLLILRFKHGIEWRTNLKDTDVAKKVKPEAYLVGSAWEFDNDGNFVQVHYPEKSVASQGRTSGSLKQMPVSA